MRILLRALLAVLLGLCAALPVLGGEEFGGGEGGVWILPRSQTLTSGSGTRQLNLARETRQITDLSKGIDMQMSTEVGLAAAVLTVPASNTSAELEVDGHVVSVPGVMLVDMQVAGVQRADVLVSDGNGNGYVVAIVFTSTGATVYVF